MIRPYTFRIMCALPTGPVIELMRSSGTYTNDVWNTWTRDLSQQWDVWCERTMPDKDCISSRPKIRYNPADHRDKLPLSREEKRIAGIETYYAI
jgi:hypothetical protein